MCRTCHKRGVINMRRTKLPVRSGGWYAALLAICGTLGGLCPPLLPEANAQPPAAAKRAPPRPLEFPADLPGSTAPEIRLPPADPSNAARREQAVNRLYEQLPANPCETQPPSAEGRALTLEELQQMALAQSPSVRQAMADVQSAQGAVIQAGAWPNPTMGYQGDTVNTGGTLGYQGGFINQTFVTGNKLGLDQMIACADLRIAELACRKARMDVLTHVRTHYFDVLVALEKMKVGEAMAEFAQRTYRTQVERVKAGEAAPYEPLQLRIAAVQARSQVVQAHSSYSSAWRQLAAALGAPQLRPAQVAGRLDAPVPQINYDAALEQMLRVHPDLLTAQETLVRAQYKLQRARVTPIPDVTVNTVVQHDYTTPPFNTTYNLQIGVPVPIFNRNRGNILSAEADLSHFAQERDRVRNDLIPTLADAFSRYQTNRALVDYYRTCILAQQIMVYRGIYKRHMEDPEAVNFNDVVTAQQSVATNLTSYLQALNDQWQAVVDLAAVLQVEELEQMGPPQASADIPAYPSGAAPGNLLDGLPTPPSEPAGRK